MNPEQSFILGATDRESILQSGRMSNRHGMIAGATGSGKTVTLQVLAEGFSRMGVPVFAADLKGDLSGLATAGTPHPKIAERLQQIPLEGFQHRPFPVVFWDIQGETGHPVRTTIAKMGPLLLANLLGLNETQEGILYAAFRIADEEGMLMLDLKDMRAMLNWMTGNGVALRGTYGNISTSSVGAIQRRLLVLEEQGGDRLFGEPALQLNDLMQVNLAGDGVISLLDATKLVTRSPRIYSVFLLWLLSELFEQLPEQGDSDKPRMVFFFDEAHLLFDRAPKPLLEKIEQVVRLIRSKGIGIYFVSQSPMDIPEDVLGQLGLKIQHALRVFTPKDRKAIKTVAENFPENPELNTETAITNLGIGEALVSTLDTGGSPTPVQRTLIRPPESRIGPLADAERRERIEGSPLTGRYEALIDQESAFELLKARTAALEAKREQQRRRKAQSHRSGGGGRTRQSTKEAIIKSAARSIASQLGRQIIRGIMGSLFGPKR